MLSIKPLQGVCKRSFMLFWPGVHIVLQNWSLFYKSKLFCFLSKLCFSHHSLAVHVYKPKYTQGFRKMNLKVRFTGFICILGHIIRISVCLSQSGVKVARSHSFSMRAGVELRRERRGAFWDDGSVEESWNQVNFMVMSYDAVGRQPIRM